jgi:7-cyano-7-deazaguanosine (preQ0) biosynthesis protein QueE
MTGEQSDATLVVSEVFGPTWQGEGPSIGRRAGFVRLGRCNLSCSWCDSAFTWNWDRFDPAVELQRRSVDGVLAELDSMGIERVVVTGGEPLLQQRALAQLIGSCRARGWRVEVETAGTLAPIPALTEAVGQWNVSPKLANSGVAVERRRKPDVLRALQATDRAAFKFVVTQPTDLEEVDQLVTECGLRNVWIMPEGTDAVTVVARLQELADPVLARGWNLTPRLHILIWGDRRGV